MSRRKTEPAIDYSRVTKRFYRREEAAYAVGVSTDTVDRRIADHGMRTHKLGRCVLIPAADVDRWVAEIEQS